MYLHEKLKDSVSNQPDPKYISATHGCVATSYVIQSSFSILCRDHAVLIVCFGLGTKTLGQGV